MYCQNCGNKLKKGIRICPNCGFENKSKNFQTKLKNVLLISFILFLSILLGSYFLVYLGYFKVPNNIKTILYEYKILPEYNDKDLVKGSLIYRKEGAKNPEAYIEDSRDGNKYRIVKMPDGNWWMAENLRFSKNLYIDNFYYQVNGINITGSLKNFINTGDNAWCDTLNLPVDINFEKVCNKYGLLYPGNAMKNKVLCPDGWEVPSREQWVRMLYETAKIEQIESNINDNVFNLGHVLKSYKDGWGVTGNIYQVDDNYGFTVIPVTGNKVLYIYNNNSLQEFKKVDLEYMDRDYQKRFLWPSKFWTRDIETQNRGSDLPNQTYFSSIEFWNGKSIQVKAENANSGISIRCIKRN